MIGRMRAGLRLQILVLLGGLLLVSFVVLYLAVAGYTRVAFKQMRTNHARSLGRAVAAQVAEAQRHRPAAELTPLLRAQLGGDGVEGIGVYAADGRVLAHAGAVDGVQAFGQAAVVGEKAYETRDGRALVVIVPAAEGAVAAVLSIDDQSARAAPLLRLVALYTGLVAVVLLLLCYYALTRLLVRPLDQLTHAAERVASGARRLALPASRVRELSDLSTSLHAMTEKLVSEEEALRRKVDEVQAATARLAEAQQRLIRSERIASVGRLAAGLAHEIGNPIAALIGLLDLMLEGGLEPDEQRDFLRRMQREAARIHDILRDLLQFARGKPEGEPAEPGNVAAAVADTAALVVHQKEMKDVKLELDLPADLPLVGMSREQLVQIVLNLLLNAADAVSPRGVVQVRARALPDAVELVVEDDGPGVVPALRDRLFEPFVTSKEVGKGTGLGLAVCRGLVEAAGGSITLDEAHANGARFVVLVPRAKSGEIPASAAAP